MDRQRVTLPYGFTWELLPLTFERARLVVTDGVGIENSW